MTLVADASVAIKWFIQEVGSSRARALLDSDERLIAPDLIIPETCNVTWKHLRAGRISEAQAHLVGERIGAAFDSLWPTPPLAPRAMALARILDHPVYDCFYLALAEAEHATLVTNDKRLLRVLQGTELSGRAIALDATA